MNILKKIFTLGGLLGTKKKTPKKRFKNDNFTKNSHKDSKLRKKQIDKNKTYKAKKASVKTENSNSSANRKKSYYKNENKKYVPLEVPEARGIDELSAKVPAFTALGLDAKILSAIYDINYKIPTPIQKEAIPMILAGRDIIGTAQTGTGKTAAFALPIIQRLGKGCGIPKVLVLSPTRELASQTATAFDKFSKYVGLRTLLIQGGVSMERQVVALSEGVDIITATPGRLLDHVRNKTINLKTINYLILDEVDRMFDMGFIEDVSNIIRYCPKGRQTLFFSATMPDEVLKLSKWALNNPVQTSMGIAHSPADTIEHYVYPVDAIQKYDLLIELVKQLDYSSMIVFTRTRIDADRISEWLEGHDYKISTLHSDRSQRERDNALQNFKDGKSRILVATDIASRGLDISNVGCVINYNVPEHPEDYVHRIGRTGRANREGLAVTLYSSDETSFLKKVESFIEMQIPRKKLDSFAYRYEPDLNLQPKRSHRRNR